MKKLAILLSFLILVSVGCKKSVESETKRWETNKATLEKLAVEYPAFKSTIDQVIAKASEAMTSAGSISDEAKKIEALAAANELANPTFVRDLQSFSEQVTKLQELSTSALQNASDENDRLAAKQAADNATTAINDAKNMLKNQTVTNESEANTLIAKALSDLDGVKTTLEQIVKTTADKVKKVEDEKAQIEKKAEDEKKALADIKCEYCNTMNKYDATKCTSCGAPIEKK